MDAGTLQTLRLAAQSKRDKQSAPRWTEMAARTEYVNFLNSDNEYASVFVNGKNASYIVTRLNALIRKDGMSELVYAIEHDGEAVLVKLVSDESDS